MVRISIAAFLCAALAAGAATAGAAPARDRLVQLVECHAFTAASLAEESRQLKPGAAWTATHQSLWSRGRAHEVVTRVLHRSMDREAAQLVLDANFPEGLDASGPAMRVERRQRCRKLYAEITAQETRAGRAMASRTPFDAVR